ncbi:AMP-dependent synthetase/ligase [Arthrobacter sp. zg-Y820]|uniref:AMP-dependent synthetase/ligase n=1 Tax=unclassified Arthrobacter TaxID=235627 RepID=UPI002541031A|nr:MULTISPECIES: AMP-dependent synthetase/ligase [unclassified Arthrobacter]MCC9197965.1 AMP-dependent synthetase/ligase [Arthrobacter sp. zg-Y820]MDK1280832.1 AMP-dependent synthetase/ligase [Arthrobacter sp. zg.Y820]WIB10314.1 AMP-dependent synthetase/ligase [Arthrobacter sp. zg-Y820]
MRESATDLLVHLAPESNITDILVGLHARTPDHPLFSLKSDGGWKDVTANDFLTSVSELAKGLIGLGVRPGDSVAVMSKTCYEWTLVDLAVWFAGAVTVPIYETSSPSQVEWILQDSGASHVFVEDARKAAVVSAAAAAGEVGEVEVQIWLMNDDAAAGAFRELIAAGSGVDDDRLEAARTAAGLESVASMVYTSGTTGRPKGCEITHGNFALFGVNIVEFLPEMLKEKGVSTLMFLPLAHVLARAVQVGCLAAGVRVGHSSSAADLMADLKSFQPTFLLAVPRIFEKIYAGAQASAEAAGKGKLFTAAAETAVAYSTAVDAAARGNKGPSAALKLRHALFDKMLYPKVRNAFGGKLTYAISGASALSPQLTHFFRGAGVMVLEGYGLTETTAPATVNTVPLARVGSVGMPLPGSAVRIADDGEVLISGAGVFKGYHNNPAANAAAFTGEWFHSGDMGALDDDGFLTITGRKKDILVTAGGKNIAPGPLEEKIREHRLVSQAIVVGEGRPFVTALLTLDDETLAGWARENGSSVTSKTAADDPRVRASLQEAVDAANATVSQAEQIRKFTVLPQDFSLESGHLTATLKLRRNAVIADYSAEVEKLYTK